jgi:hypothetical protein
MEAHIDDLAFRGASVDGQRADLILDLRVQPGGAGTASDLIQYASQRGVGVVLKEY